MDFINGWEECLEGIKNQLNRSMARYDDGTSKSVVKAFNEVIAYINWQTVSVKNMREDYAEPCEDCGDCITPQGVDTQEIIDSVLKALDEGKTVTIGGTR